MRTALLSGLAVYLVMGVGPAWAAPVHTGVTPEESLADRVGRAIDRGVKYLRSQQREIDGSWEITAALATSNPGGQTSLALLALLNAGVPVNDPAVQRGLKYLRKITSDRTYVVALQTMVFTQAGQATDRERIQRNVNWLVTNWGPDGWSYGLVRDQINLMGDNSNTEYALLGQHAAHKAGARLGPWTLKTIHQLFIDQQRNLGTGGWNYRRGTRTTMTMTTGGLCGLLITGMDGGLDGQKLRPNGSAENCGVYRDERNVAYALDWIGQHFPSRIKKEEAVDLFGSPFYCLYGIEQAGSLTGQRFFRGHDWYEVGSRYLLDTQRADGSWGGSAEEGQADHWPMVATSYSLLFLAEGRTPVLVAKLAYGPQDYTGWNNKRSDVLHLVEFASRELFKGRRLAWQAFDVRDMEAERRRLTDALSEVPVVYFNGHDRVPTGKEEALLKDYLARGGFVFAEACCGDARFDRAFRALMKRLFPDTALRPLPQDHPVWTAGGKWAVVPREFPLEEIQQGGRSVVIYSPRPLAGYWEAGEQQVKGRGLDAFRLGAGVIAYATGLKVPPPRGDKTKAGDTRER